MSEKHLTELPWKTLATKQGVKDLGLGKALAGYIGLDSATEPAKVLETLKEISELAVKLKKANPTKAEVVAHLDEILKEVKKTTPGVEAKVKTRPAAQPEVPLAPPKPPVAGAASGKVPAAPPAKPAAQDDDEEKEAAEFKKDLKQKMVSALAQVKTRAPGDPAQQQEQKPQLQFMAYVAGKNCATIVTRKVGAATRKLLPDIIGGASGGQFVSGECIFEKNAHTFVLDKVPGGLAAKLAKALLAETGQKFKVRVRSADGSVTLDSDTDTDPDEKAPIPPPGLAQTPAELAAKYQQRLKALLPGLQRAFKEQLGDTGKMRATAEFSREKATARDFEAALKSLDALEKLLQVAGLASGSTAGQEGGFSKVQFETIHLDWDARKQKVQASLSELHRAILEEFDDGESAAAAKKLEKVLARFNEGLGDTLDQMRNATEGKARQDLAQKAGQIADRYLAYLETDVLVAHVETNPYEVPVMVRETLSSPLAALKGELAKLRA